MNNSHAVYVKFIGPTNCKGSRVQFKTFDLADNKAKTKTVPFNHVHSLSTDQAISEFEKAGLKIVGMNGRNKDFNLFLIEWDFEKLSKFFNFKRGE